MSGLEMRLVAEPDYAKVTQDILDAFYNSESIDMSGKKDYVDVIYKIYYMHLYTKNPNDQKIILQKLFDYLEKNALKIGFLNPIKAFKIREIINSPESPEWVNKIFTVNQSGGDGMGRELYTIFQEKVSGKDTEILYHSYIEKNKTKIDYAVKSDEEWRNAGFFEKVKILFSNLLAKIKRMFSTIEPELVSKPIVSSESRIDSPGIPVRTLKNENLQSKTSKLTANASNFAKLAKQVSGTEPSTLELQQSKPEKKPSMVSKVVHMFSRRFVKNDEKERTNESGKRPSNSGPGGGKT